MQLVLGSIVVAGAALRLPVCSIPAARAVARVASARLGRCWFLEHNKLAMIII